MDQPSSIKLFKENNIRYVWDDEKEDWYFSLFDIISFLIDCTNPEEYVKEILSHDKDLSLRWNTICVPVQMPGNDGNKHEVQSVNTQGLFRIIQSIPSKKSRTNQAISCRNGHRTLKANAKSRTLHTTGSSGLS